MSRRGSVSYSCHSSVSSVDNCGAWKKRKREDDGIENYHLAFAGVRNALEQQIFEDKAKLSKNTIGSILKSFARVESIFMDTRSNSCPEFVRELVLYKSRI